MQEVNDPRKGLYSYFKEDETFEKFIAHTRNMGIDWDDDEVKERINNNPGELMIIVSFFEIGITGRLLKAINKLA